MIVVRFVWVFPVTYLPRWLWPPLRKREPPPNWKPAFLVGYTGLRGAVSLAAALTVPLTVGGAPFPHRDLILFTTICVIVATLVIQGAGLDSGREVAWPRSRRRARGRREHAGGKRREGQGRRRRARLARPDRKGCGRLQPGHRGAATARIRATGELYRRDRGGAGRTSRSPSSTPCGSTSSTPNGWRIARNTKGNRITDEARRRIERELDLEEASIRHSLTHELRDGAASG